MIGQTVSRYKILERLGGGGMGVVYKAQDLKLDRSVALKFLPPELTRDPEANQRFVHEAKSASALQHNNICTVHDIDETFGGQLFIVMDFYEGETLRLAAVRGGLRERPALFRMKSIAVLPFNPFDRSFDDTVFADGMHDDIFTQLSKISGRRVIARTSMMLYRDSKKTPQQIGNELNVGYLLEGSTLRSGGKIRITAQLIKTADEGHARSETCDMVKSVCQLSNSG